MILSTLFLGILSGCLLSVLVGIVGSGRRIGFGWAFLISLIFTPLVGLIAALISDPLPNGQKRWGCIGTIVAVLGFICLLLFVLALIMGVSVLTI